MMPPELPATPVRPLLPRRGGRLLATGLSLLLAGCQPVVLAQTSAERGSPAQTLFNTVNMLIQQEYGGLSTVDRPALQREYQGRLDAVCAPSPAECAESKAYPVIEAEITALGDEHSFFQNPEDLKTFAARLTGGTTRQFGVQLAMLDGESRVITEVVPGSTADAAGLRRGDLLLTIDGQPYTYAALRAARDKGTPMTLGLSRLGQALTLTLTSSESSTRQLPLIQYVPASPRSALQGEVGVLRIPTFSAGGGIAQRVHDLVGQAQERGVVGMVVDLRSNPGGSLSECDSAVSAFVPTLTRLARSVDGNSRTVVSRGTRVEQGRLPSGVANPHLWAGPLTVLVDKGSASCSEFFAFEVQYAGRGVIVGETTAGVGNTATVDFTISARTAAPGNLRRVSVINPTGYVPSPGESALQLTILNYAKPDGTPYPVRVTPDQPVTQGEEQIRRLTQGQDDLLNAALSALATAPVLGSDPYSQTP